MINASALVAALFVLAGRIELHGAEPVPEPFSFFRHQIGLTDQQIAMIGQGKPVATVMPSKGPAEIFVFGAVFVEAKAEAYAGMSFDLVRLRNSPNYLAVGRFGSTPTLADLEGFNLEPEDIRSLRTCKPGKCDVQLPAEMIRELRTSINWSAPNAATLANDRMRRMALDILNRYRLEGNRVLGTYRDTSDPFEVNVELRSLVARSQALPVYLPGLGRYLLEFPQEPLANVESVFYWERVNFGLKPTLRLNHGMAYRSDGPRGSAYVVAVKQLYASHYLQLALDLTACVPATRGGKSGFYLISLKGSTQQGLTGFTGSILRRVIVSRTRAAQERMLLNIKRTLEQGK